MKKRKFTAIVTRGEVAYVAYCTELGVASQGKTPEEAKKNLIEAVELYLEETTHSHVKARVPLITTISV